MLVFEERGNQSTAGEKPIGAENQQIQPTHNAESGNRKLGHINGRHAISALTTA